MLHFSASLCRQLTTSIINDEKLSEVNLSFCRSYTKLVKFENLLVSKFYNPSTYIYCEQNGQFMFRSFWMFRSS